MLYVKQLVHVYWFVNFDNNQHIIDQVTHGEDAMMTASSPTPFEGRSDSRKHPSLNKRVNSIQSLPDNEKVNGNPKVNRTGSTHVPISKQESSSSAFSQGSGSSGRDHYLISWFVQRFIKHSHSSTFSRAKAPFFFS